MTDQAAADFAPILKSFPQSTLDEDGHPEIRMVLSDRAGDPVLLSFEDGCVVFPAKPVALRTSALDILVQKANWADRLIYDWIRSPSGKAWATAQGIA